MSGTVSPSPLLTLGLLAGSSMENERRLPIHPHHLDLIDSDIRARMIVENGYGSDFQVEPGYVEARVGTVTDRAKVIKSADVLMLPKPHGRRQRAPRGARAVGVAALCPGH